MENAKKCPKCGETKPIDEFYKNKTKKDGHSVYCKQCIANDSHEYYLQNKEKCKERLNKWRSENKEYVRDRDKKYRKDNPETEFNKQKRHYWQKEYDKY